MRKPKDSTENTGNPAQNEAIGGGAAVAGAVDVTSFKDDQYVTQA